MGLEMLVEFDFISDIQNEWDEYMEEGCTIEEATTQLLTQYEDLMEEEEQDLLYIALGMLQIDSEYMDKRIKESIVEILENKSVEDYDVKYGRGLKKVLNLLKKKYK